MSRHRCPFVSTIEVDNWNCTPFDARAQLRLSRLKPELQLAKHQGERFAGEFVARHTPAKKMTRPRTPRPIAMSAIEMTPILLRANLLISPDKELSKNLPKG